MIYGRTILPVYMLSRFSGLGRIALIAPYAVRYIFLFSLFCFSFNAYAITYLPAGGVASEGDHIWAKKHSPYIIPDGRYTFPHDSTLIIEPGVVVKFSPEGRLYAGGDVLAVGDSLNPIIFTTIFDSRYGGDTSGGGVLLPENEMDSTLSFSGSNNQLVHVKFENVAFVGMSYGSTTLQYVDATKLYYGVSLYESVTLIEDSSFNDIYDSCLYIVDGSTTVLRTQFNRCYTGIQSTPLAEVSVESSQFIGGVTGIYFPAPQILSVQDKIQHHLAKFFHRLFPRAIADRVVVIQQSSFVGHEWAAIDDDNDSPLLDVRNNWWGDASGPSHALNSTGAGDAIYSDDIMYEPWLISDPFAPQPPPPPPPEPPTSAPHSNVLFLPGFQASRLYVKNGGSENQLWEPNRSHDGELLYLLPSGEAVTPNVYVRDVIDETNTPFSMGNAGVNIYKSFMSKMDDLVEEGAITMWKAFPYDWRYDFDRILQDGVLQEDGTRRYLINTLEALAATSTTGKVTIVAHSNGGLLAKALMMELQRLGKENLVDTIVFVAVPHVGTPQAIAALLHGDDTGMLRGFLLKNYVGRNLGQYMQSAYNLLPSLSYFERISEPVITFDENAFRIPFFARSTGAVNNYMSMVEFLDGGGTRQQPVETNVSYPSVLEKAIIEKSATNHASLDSWVPPATVAVYQFAGWGRNDTLKQVHYSTVVSNVCQTKKGLLICEPKYSPRVNLVYTDDGDKTVVSPSASWINATTSYLDLRKYSADNSPIDHKAILEVPGIITAITDLLLSTTTVVSPFLTSVKPVSTSQRLALAMHSPVSISAVDLKGNMTGAVTLADSEWEGMTYVREDIPQSGYREIGEDKFLVVDFAASTTILLEGQGAGTFTLNVDRYEGDSIVAVDTYVDLPVTPLTRGVLAVTPDETRLQLDVDGNGSFDITVQPTDVFDATIFLSVLRQTVLVFDVKKSVRDRILKKIDRVEKLLEKDKTKNVYRLLSSSVKNLEIRKFWQKRLTTSDKETLILSFENLLTNL